MTADISEPRFATDPATPTDAAPAPVAVTEARAPAPATARRPSARSRLVRRAMIVAVRTMRARGGGGTPDPDGPVSDLEEYALGMRTAMEKMASRLPVTRGVTTRDEPDAPVPGLWVVDDRARVHDRSGQPDHGDEIATTQRVVLHLHGGAYCLGSPATHRGLGATLSRTSRAAVFLPEYRLAPEHVFPAALDDAYATYRWLIEERGVPPERLAVTGDSAGGGLAAALLVRLRDEGLPLPACYVGMSPWTDLAGTGGSLTELDGTDPWLSAAMIAPAARGYAGDTALDDPGLSPLYAELRGLPPVLVHVGGDEILLDDAVRFVDACRAAGVDASLGRFEGLWHVFHAFPGMPESRNALREIGAFVRRHASADGVASTSAG
jgi:epsilon-lactone hydrolase